MAFDAFAFGAKVSAPPFFSSFNRFEQLDPDLLSLKLPAAKDKFLKCFSEKKKSGSIPELFYLLLLLRLRLRLRRRRRLRRVEAVTARELKRSISSRDGR